MRVRDGVLHGFGYFFPALISFPTALTGSLARDEQMYVTAGALARDHALYRDFAYFQMPYLPWIYAPILGVAGDHHLLPLRLLTALVFWGLALVCLELVRRVTGSWFLGLASSVLILCSETVLLGGSLASNHLPALLFFAGAILFIALWTRDPDRIRVLTLGGLCLGISIGIRLTYLAYVPLCLIFVFSHSTGTRMRATGLFLSGLGLALLPAILVFLRDPEAFWFNNLQYHLANTRWRELMGQRMTMTWPSKFDNAWGFLEDSSHLPLWITALVCTAVLGFQRKLSRSSAALAWGGLFVISMILATLPRPVPTLYYLPAVVGLVLWVVMSVHFLEGRSRRVGSVLLIVCVLIAVGDAGEDLLESCRDFLEVEAWTPVRVRREIAPYRDLLGGEWVATISPVHALELGAEIPVEFSTGPFFYRVGDTLTPYQRERFHGTSMITVSRVLAEASVAAVITGIDRNSENWGQPLGEWAQGAGYLPQPLDGLGATMWVKPKRSIP